MKIILSSLAIASLAVGCGSKSENSKAQDISSLPGAATGQGLKEVTKDSSDLIGTWNWPCYKVKDNWFRLYTTTYTSTEATIYSQYFSKDGCASADRELSDSFVGTYTTEGSKINYNFEKYYVTPYTAALVEEYKGYCSDLTWGIGTAAEASQCEVFKDFAGMFYDIFKVEGSKLFTGDQTEGHGGSTEATRPIEFAKDYAVKSDVK